jgi:pilus assembly protein FimV
MNAPIKLSLAIALALAGTNVWALGLGAIQVKSGLNQPLIAEIPVTVSSPGEAADLAVSLATDEDFVRVGLSRARVGATLQFAVVTQPHGGTVIQVTSTENVREPYLDFLLQANWAKGKLLREYTVLLDPPVTAPAAKSSIATVNKPAPAPAPVVAKTPAIVPGDTAASKVRQPSPAPAPVAAAKAPVAAAASAAMSDKEFGPVTSGSALSQVAQAVRGDSSTDLNRLMLALYKANPQAFFKPNINALKTGAVLRIPSADEIQAVGSLREAAAQVHSQSRDWASGVQPTMVAGGQTDVSSKPNKAPAKSDGADKKGANERLALVPPRAGKDDQGKTDQPGATGQGKSAAINGGVAELARAQESLVAREHEAAELKSRLKDLEDIKSKNDRLISLKDSEIAELQRKLKDTQEAATKAAAVAAAKPAASAPVTPVVAGVKTIDAKPVVDSKPITAVIPVIPPPAITPVLTDAEKAKAAAANAPIIPPAGKSDATPPVTVAVVPPVATITPMPAMPPATTPTPVPSSPPLGDVTPVTLAPSASSEAPHVTAPTPVVVAAPVKPAAIAAKPAVTAPVVADEPWYKNTLILSGAGALLLIVGLFALLRSRKPTTPIRPVRETSVSDDLDGPHVQDEEEHALLENLARHPDDIDLHLELLSLYYAHRDVAKFESAAQAMHAQITDPSQLEWQQVKAMGAELAPTHPLFADAEYHAHYVSDHDDTVLDHDSALRPDHSDDFEPTKAAAWAAPAAHDAVTQPHQLHLDSEELDLPLDHDFDVTPASHNVVDMEELEHDHSLPLHAEPLALEEAIVTKLDLARAYLDMGDPDGARSMIEEVIAEGNETQQQEARKLLEELR